MKGPNRIARAIIDATVDRGLREVAEDPKRSIRKLTDLGKQFSKNRFLEEIYGMMQDLLRNDDSPYYTVIENLLRNTDRQGLKDFGINIGYHSLTFGGKRIRGEQSEKNYYTPWALTMRIAPDLPNTLSVQEIKSCVTQGMPLGIFTYVIHYRGRLSALPELLTMVAEMRDCSFFISYPDQALGAQHVELLTKCTNILSLFSSEDGNTEENIRALRAAKCLCGIYQPYNDKSYREIVTDKNLKKLAGYQCGFVILSPDDGTSYKTREAALQFCKDARTHPTHPFILFDAEGGVREVDHIVSGNHNYLEILENGDLRTQDGIISDFRHTIALEQLLQIALSRDPS